MNQSSIPVRFRKTFMHNAMLCCLALIAMSLCQACGNDNDTVPDKPKTGEVDFTLNLPGGESGTVSSPVTVPNDTPLNIEITQRSSYKDYDGKVITCEPKATIALEVHSDTVVAKDLASLTEVKGGAVNTTTSGTSPVCHRTAQTLKIGGQEIALDLAYEVFTLNNSVGEKIEMPYFRLNPAKLGGSDATGEEGKSRAVVAVSSVTVRPLMKSRASTVTDSTMYEVNVRFNIGIESVNTAENDSRSLEFLLTYVGVVETTTTLEDPKVELSYAWDVISGTSCTASPFVQTAGQDMELSLAQSSVYTDEYLNRYVSEPKARIKISAVRDTVRASSLDELTKLTETSDNASGTAAATQIFAVGGENISIDWSYDKAVAPEGLDVDMPYYRLSPVRLKEVTTKEIEDDDNAESENDIAIYEVTATFVQTAEAEGKDGDYTKSFDAEYVVTYIGTMEVKVVDIKYDRRYEWYDSHDNLALRVGYIIDRELTYSNGKTKKEEYHSGNFMVDCIAFSSAVGDDVYKELPLENDEFLVFYPGKSVFVDDYNLIYSCKTGVPDLNKLSYNLAEDFYSDPYGPENYSTYRCWGYSDIRFGNENHPQGWYVGWVLHNRMINIVYEGNPYCHYLRENTIRTGFTDRFYCFKDDDTGKDTVIDFADWYLVPEYSFTVEDTVIPEGPARIYKHECRSHYLGKEFYNAMVDTIYQNK